MRALLLNDLRTKNSSFSLTRFELATYLEAIVSTPTELQSYSSLLEAIVLLTKR